MNRCSSCVSLDADGIDVQMVSRGPDQGDQRVDQQIPQARFAHGAVRVPSTALDHGKVNPQPRIFIMHLTTPLSFVPEQPLTLIMFGLVNGWHGSLSRQHCYSSNTQVPHHSRHAYVMFGAGHGGVWGSQPTTRLK